MFSVYKLFVTGESGPKNSTTNLEWKSSELYLQFSQVQTDDDQEA